MAASASHNGVDVTPHMDKDPGQAKAAIARAVPSTGPRPPLRYKPIAYRNTGGVSPNPANDVTNYAH